MIENTCDITRRVHMKLLIFLSLLSLNAHAVQTNLTCVSEEGEELASVFTPHLSYLTLQFKADFEHNGEQISINESFLGSSDVVGLSIAKTERFTAVGISETSPFDVESKMEIDILENGLSVLKLFCETTLHNPVFPRD